MTETEHFRYLLRVAGVTLLSVTEDSLHRGGIDGNILRAVKQFQARQFLISLSQNTLRGQMSSVMGQSDPGRMSPYGYDREIVGPDGNMPCAGQRRTGRAEQPLAPLGLAPLRRLHAPVLGREKAKGRAGQSVVETNYYTCSGRRGKGKAICAHSAHVRADDLEAWVLGKLTGLVLADADGMDSVGRSLRGGQRRRIQRRRPARPQGQRGRCNGERVRQRHRPRERITGLANTASGRREWWFGWGPERIRDAA